MGETERIYKFDIDNLGRIKKSSVHLRPLTLFVGENNSGKSYLSTMLWGIFQASASALFDEQSEGWKSGRALVQQAMSELAGWATEKAHSIDSSGTAVPMMKTVEIHGNWAEWVKDIEESVYARIAHACFRTDTVNPAVRRPLADFSGPFSLTMTLLPVTRATGASPASVIALARPSGETVGTIHGQASAFAGGMFAAVLLGEYLGLPQTEPSFGYALQESLTQISVGGAHYFPASRTGYIQMLPSVVDRLLSGVGGLESPRRPQIEGVTAPVVQFLRSLVRAPTYFEDRDYPFAGIADDLERSVLGGQVARDSGLGRFNYTPKGASSALPISRSSAVVSELVPLLFFLRETSTPPKLLIYEEPEAHLHPRLQQLVADALVAMVRTGCRVLVTTHSDTMVQQINNAIKKGSLWAAQPHGDEPMPTDMILAEDVAAYEFQFDDNGDTVVQELPTREDGIAMPLFNETIWKQAQEARRLDDELEALSSQGQSSAT